MDSSKRLRLAKRLRDQLRARNAELARVREKVAIVGVACRFPEGENPAAFWRALESGTDAVTRGRREGPAVDPDTAGAPVWGAYLPELDRFDAEFFRISRVEAELMDPQQRLLLEVSWEALEDAGLDPGGLARSRTGVYAGISASDYRELLDLDGCDGAEGLYAATGMSFSTAIGRVAFALGLEGPAIAVDTACSSSLVAVHQAVAGLQRGEADLALAGGVNAIPTARVTRLLASAGMLAPDGRCKTFDAAADGYVRGEGCGMLVLKRLSDAVRDGDRVWAVILGSAVNQDGASAGFTVPNGTAQERVIGEALERAGIAPAGVDYLEAHGTGTELGDPIEVRAAAAAYRAGRDADHPLLLGSVKTNIGHLEAAAGIAGLIKVLLAMQAGVIPRHLHFERPNPRLDWERLPVRVVSGGDALAGRSLDRPVRAGVSSFGFSGTNAHLILESYDDPASAAGAAGLAAGIACHRQASAPPPPPPPPVRQDARGALRALASRYRGWLAAEERDAEALSDMAWTAGTGRSHFAHRAGLVFRDRGELEEQLRELEVSGERAASRAGRVAFLYTGQGSQWAGMGRALYEREPVFREVLDRCAAVLREERGEAPTGGAGLLGVMFGDAEGLGRTEWTQPALYALGCGLTALWGSVGVRPDAVFGHSVGELAAARTAGVFDLEAGLRFAARRGALMGSLPSGGAMAAVFAPVERVEEALPAGVSLAAENGAHCVVSGPGAEVAGLIGELESSGVRTERLSVSHAFHSALMEPVLDALEALAPAGARPSVPLVGNLTGRVVPEAPDGGGWRRQAREPVRFASAVRTLAELGVGVLVEIGPRTVLGPLAASAWPEPGEGVPVLVPGLSGKDEDGFPRAVAAAYEAGLDVSFEGLFAGETRRRVALPTYPFQRERHWVSPARRRVAGAHPLLGARRDSPDGEISFETELSASDPGWLGEHRVFGEPVAPGALFAAQAIEAFRVSGKGPAVELHEGRIDRPLLLADDEVRTVQAVLSPDGSWVVASRADLRTGKAGAWERHAEGRVAPLDPAPATVADLAGLRAGLEPVEVSGLYERLGAEGITYGPAFRGLMRLWSGPGEAIGDVVLPSGVKPGGLLAHPALLDAAFQVLAGVPELSAEGGAWLPIGWDRLELRGALAGLVVCRALVHGDGAETRKADLAFYGETGEALGGVAGFRLKRASRSALVGSRVDGLLYEVEWRAAPPAGLRGAEFVAGPEAVASVLDPVEEHLEAEGLDREGLVALGEALEGAARRHALRGLVELGWERRAGDRFDGEQLRRRLRVTGDHRRLFGRLLALLEAAGVLAREPAGGWLVPPGSREALPESPDPGRTAGSIEGALLERCGESLAEVLRGRADPMELLFGGAPSAADLYSKPASARALNRLVASAVERAAAGLPEGRRLRVLEVGAGTGGTTAAVLPRLPAGRADYEFTDISAGFFAAAERRLGGAAVDIRFRELDIERDPGQQGFRAHGYDLVIAANVLHATRDLGESLGNCRRLLAPSGLLVAVEGTRPQGWLDLTFGLLPGWWRFADAYRPEHALADGAAWRRALADTGYGEASFLDFEGGQTVILARGPAEVEPEAGRFVLAGGPGAREGTRAGTGTPG